MKLKHGDIVVLQDDLYDFFLDAFKELRDEGGYVPKEQMGEYLDLTFRKGEKFVYKIEEDGDGYFYKLEPSDLWPEVSYEIPEHTLIAHVRKEEE